ncbi:hypothetical protein BKA57DRAFT_502309 [Linnemannia elongata]|nr:hypothetical protein BKA57DRAFT_502309 [Linnemannia elongata]
MPPSFSIVESALAFQLDQPTNVSKTSVYSGSSRPLSSRSRHPSPSTTPANRQSTVYKEDDRGSATGVLLESVVLYNGFEKQKIASTAGFEPARENPFDFKSNALDHSAKLT